MNDDTAVMGRAAPVSYELVETKEYDALKARLQAAYRRVYQLEELISTEDWDKHNLDDDALPGLEAALSDESAVQVRCHRCAKMRDKAEKAEARLQAVEGEARGLLRAHFFGTVSEKEHALRHLQEVLSDESDNLVDPDPVATKLIAKLRRQKGQLEARLQAVDDLARETVGFCRMLEVAEADVTLSPAYESLLAKLKEAGFDVHDDAALSDESDAPAEAAESETCEWRHDGDFWLTGCGYAHRRPAGETLPEVCQETGCGKPIVTAPREPSPERSEPDPWEDFATSEETGLREPQDEEQGDSPSSEETPPLHRFNVRSNGTIAKHSYGRWVLFRVVEDVLREANARAEAAEERERGLLDRVFRFIKQDRGKFISDSSCVAFERNLRSHLAAQPAQEDE